MTAGESNLAEIVARFHAGASRLRDLNGRNQIARARVRIAEAENLALHVLERSDAAVFAGKADRVVAEALVKVDFDQYGLDGLRIGQVGLGVGRWPEPSEIDGAAEQALNHAIIVGGCEQLGRDAEQFLGFGSEALIGGEAVLGIFAAKDADAELGDVLGEGRRDHRRRQQQRCKKLLHFFLR